MHTFPEVPALNRGARFGNRISLLFFSPVLVGTGVPLVASRRASPASPSANRAAARREKESLAPMRLREAKSFAEGDAGEAPSEARRGPARADHSSHLREVLDGVGGS